MIAQEPIHLSMIDICFDRLVLVHKDRAYHNWSHIEDKINWTLELAGLHNLNEKEIAENLLADFYHDAVCDSRSKTNESDSAQMYKQDISILCKHTPSDQTICDLIEITAKHGIETSSAQMQVMIDSDLAILSDVDYDKYARGIRIEYGWVSDEDYAKGRIAVLNSLKDLRDGKIYYTPELRCARMITNILNEIKELQSLL